jgi:hypothetical protein
MTGMRDTDSGCRLPVTGCRAQSQRERKGLDNGQQATGNYARQRPATTIEYVASFSSRAPSIP